ncbi:unnamed protein product [Brassica napus]|uniref:(rape) hypothetical protein n=1 Tax=Brassica napus TaxID=3708 RepID=A0A816T7J3_BRANA|nr:unnamed protein product [Brassica napus]
MWSQNPSFRFEEEFWKKKKADRIFSKIFVAGGCEWKLAHDHLSVYLHATKPKSLRIGWKRNVSFYFTVLNHRKIERCRSESCFSEEDIRRASRHCIRFQTKEPSGEDSIHECPSWPHQYTK